MATYIAKIFAIISFYLNLIEFSYLNVIPLGPVEIYTNDWNPTPQVCVQGRVMGLIHVYEVMANHYF